DHPRPFELPDVPDAVVADVAFLEEGHVEVLEPGVIDQLQRLTRIRGSEWSKEIRHDFPDQLALIRGQFTHGNAFQSRGGALQANRLGAALGSSTVEQGELALASVQRGEDLIRAL